MKVSYEFDQDPRYGWASIDLDGQTTGLVVVHTASGSLGFAFSERDQEMAPTCICSAWSESECACPHLGAGYWDNDQEEDHG